MIQQRSLLRRVRTVRLMIPAIAIAMAACVWLSYAVRADDPDGQRSVPLAADAGGLPALPYLATPASPDQVGVDSSTGPYGPWSKIAFQSLRDNNWELYTSDGDGDGQARLTADPAADIAPRLNRDATRLAFASRRTGNYEIYTMPAAGGSASQLTAGNTDNVNPAWSPDGARIAFQSYRDGQPEIYVMNADGSAQQRLTDSPDYDAEPCWSPDGSRIAFISRRTGSYRVWFMWSNGAGPAMLSGQSYSGHPAWSPDGTKIAYESDGDRDGWLELWLMNADGSGQRQVFKPADALTEAWASSWSPDGRFIAFTRITYVQQNGVWYWTRAYLDAWDTQTQGAIRLSGNGLDWYPDWHSSDVTPPATSMAALPMQSTATFTVTWSGADSGGSGVAVYEVQVSDNGAEYGGWRSSSTEASAAYTGQGGHTYRFRSRAVDRAGNWSAYPEQPQAQTMVENLAPVSTMAAAAGRDARQRGDARVVGAGSRRLRHARVRRAGAR